MIQNITVRVPWSDNGWCGKVCNHPCGNTDCLRLKNIFENKNEVEEEKIAGQPIQGIENQLPCIAEGVAFMSPDELIRTVIHPYKANNPKTHGHFLDTDEHFVPYSLPSRPFLWTMKRGKNFEKYDIDYQASREPELDFENPWVQDARNHQAIFKRFYENIISNESLVFAYAKQVPFVDDPRRIVIAVGLVEEVIPSVEHNHTDAGTLRSYTWETMIRHSIRENGENGFLMPYYKLMEYAKEHSDFDIRLATVYASEDYHYEFSYATEHLSHDGTIDTLLRIIKAFEYIAQFDDIEIPTQKYINWCKNRLKKVWEDRGGYPGLGEMLYAFGIKKGIPISQKIQDYAKSNNIPIFKCVNDLFENKASYIPLELTSTITPEIIDAWNALSTERKTLFELLSRFSLSELNSKYNRYDYLFNIEKRTRYNKTWTDKDIIENPYTIFERTKYLIPELQVPVRFVDMAIFPSEIIQEKYPIAEPSKLANGTDKRRIRALIIDFLENQSNNGHSLYPIWLTINAISELPIEPSCNITGDIIFGCKEFLENQIKFVEMAKKNNPESEQKAFQLRRLYEADNLIESKIAKRLESKNPHVVNSDWRAILTKAFGDLDPNDKDEVRAREEKIAILKELAKSRLSVLIGGAGTGKTTLLSLLCSAEQIKNESVLLLAPTGKARVKMMKAMKKMGVTAEAKTVAGFLMGSNHYFYKTGQYKLTGQEADKVADNVIIDESSMLTEEMFAALMEALAKAKRIIFVGDPNQLPPIGTGRPFVDLVKKLSENIPEYIFPRVEKGFGDLQTTRRQRGVKGEVRFDVELSNWYKSDDVELDEDIFTRLQTNDTNGHVTFKKWATEDELEKLVFESITEVLPDNIDDVEHFNLSLGSTQKIKGYQYFNKGCAVKAEDWQLLAPVRNMPHGVINLNHIIQQKYRKEYLDLANNSYHIPKRMGPESIVYGDKVICIKNEPREAYPKSNENLNMVANGEIGIAMANWNNNKFLNVEYSSQPGITYGYSKRDFGEETEAILELAYALTVHKAQGSEFGTVILVLNDPCLLLSKELLYTAIARQVNKLVILYNKDAISLRDYSNSKYSEIAKRFTRLFHIPSIVKVDDKYYAENLVYKTEKGEMVRSKSEMIIANMLFENHVPYTYEKELEIGGFRKIPDFTIEDEESGDIWYWEHCGMMNDANYKKRWEAKKKLYAENGIVEEKNLIITEEDGHGFDSSEIKKIIEKYFK